MKNPFKILSDLNAMKKTMQLQAMLEKEEFDISVGNVRVVITGNQNVKLVEVNGERQQNLERAFNEAIKKSQYAVAGKIQELAKGM